MLSRGLTLKPNGKYNKSRLLCQLTRKYSNVKFPQGNDIEPGKPTIGQFKTPLFHCFLIASTTYITLQAVWISLTREEKEEEFISETKALEEKVQHLVEEKKNELDYKRNKWYNIFKIWK